jgi:hypothetical protein
MWPANPPISLPVRCPQCQQISHIAVSLGKASLGDGCYDPYFGLRLRLVVGTRHGNVWAYNRRHLGELRDYASARIRARTGGGTSALFARLPKWFKLAKHRDEMVKALTRLAQID